MSKEYDSSDETDNARGGGFKLNEATIKQIADYMNKNIEKCHPRIMELINGNEKSIRNDIETLQEADGNLHKELRMMQEEAIFSDKFDKLAQEVNMCQMDLQRIKSAWTEDKLRQLDQVIDDMDQLKFEMATFSKQFEEKANRTEVEDCMEEIKRYTKYSEFLELCKQVSFKAEHAEHEKLKARFDTS